MITKSNTQEYPGAWMTRNVDLAARSILGSDTPPVYSRGSRAYNQDRWVARFLITEICKGSKDQDLTEATLRKWLEKANNRKMDERMIVIPLTPEKVSPMMREALMGYSYHEAGHSRYDRRQRILFSEVWGPLKKIWNKVPHWNSYQEQLLQYENLFADIRLERLLCKEFYGARKPLENLHRVVISKQLEEQQEILEKTGSLDPLSILLLTIREIGKGYEIEEVYQALELYAKVAPDIFSLCQEGPLRDLIERAIHADEENQLEAMWLAFELIAFIHSESEEPESESDKEESADEDSDKGGSESSDSEGSNQENSEVGGNSSSEDESSDETSPEGGATNGADSSNPTETSTKERNLQELMDQLKEALESGNLQCVYDAADLLDKEFKKEKEEAIKREGGIQEGEEVYEHSGSDSFIVRMVPTNAGSWIQADKREKKVLREINSLQNQLRRYILAKERAKTHDGKKKGKKISNRFLVNTFTSIQAGKTPKKPYKHIDMGEKTSLSACVLMDESSSMDRNLDLASQIFMAITLPLDQLHCPVKAVGFQEGYIRIFKEFHERYGQAKHRFGETEAVGSTPMDHGIQHCLMALSPRKEGHRVLFIVTDGQPNNPHTVKRQIRLAKESGIKVIGVGIGPNTEFVKDLFPDHVWSKDKNELPRLLLQKIRQILDPNAKGRGQLYKG